MFENFFAGLMDPNFAATAASALDPNVLLQQLGAGGTPVGMNLSANLTQPTGDSSFASFLGYPGMPMGDSTMPHAGRPSPVTGDGLQKLAMDAQSLQALQAMQQRAPQQAGAPSAGVLSPRGNVAINPLGPVDNTRARNPNGVSLGQLIYGR